MSTYVDLSLRLAIFAILGSRYTVGLLSQAFEYWIVAACGQSQNAWAEFTTGRRMLVTLQNMFRFVHTNPWLSMYVVLSTRVA